MRKKLWNDDKLKEIGKRYDRRSNPMYERKVVIPPTPNYQQFVNDILAARNRVELASRLPMTAVVGGMDGGE